MAPGARRTGPQKGGKKGDVYRIGGVDLPWDPQLDLDAPRPTPIQPESKTHPPKPLSSKEKSEVFHFLTIRDKIRKGPLHAVLGDEARVSRRGGGGGSSGGGGAGAGRGDRATAAATFDAFNGMPSYSARYTPKRNVLPQLHTCPFVKDFFPGELWSTIDPDYKREEEANGKGAGRKIYNGSRGKTMQKPGYKKVDDLNQLDNELDDGKDAEGQAKDSENEEGVAAEEEEEEEEEEEADEEFDEEDEGGDYNAEQYFDDGGDDGANDYDAGEDVGVDYF